MIGEEFAGFENMTLPVLHGGLGFTHMWNVRWTEAMMNYFSLAPEYRAYNLDRLVFSATTAFEEDYILPLSYKEFVYGKRSLLEKFPGLRLAAISGGQFDNVICSRCDAVVALPKGSGRAFEAFIRELEGVLKNEYAVTDPDVTLTCAAAETAKAVSAERTVTLVQALTAMPQGVEAMDTDFPGLVQTSLNMGVVKLGGNGLHIAFSIRSSIASRKLMLAQRVRAVAALAGGTVAERGVYPGWQYKRESQFRDTLLAAYKDLTGKDGVVEATHGGLECGLLGEKLPGLDCVSFGPDLTDIHTPRERMHIASVQRTWKLLCEVLKRSK